MSVAESVQCSVFSVQSVGARIIWDHSGAKPKPMLPKDSAPQLVAYVKANRAAVIEAAKDRYCVAPEGEGRGARGEGRGERRLPPGQETRVKSYARNQSEEVRAWLIANGDDLDACVQLIEWQLAHHKDPVGWVICLGDDYQKGTK